MTQPIGFYVAPPTWAGLKYWETQCAHAVNGDGVLTEHMIANRDRCRDHFGWTYNAVDARFERIEGEPAVSRPTQEHGT